MDMLKIRNVKMNDLPELVAIEHLCFTKEEAATKEAFEKRIQMIPDSFFVAEEDGVIVGLVNGPVIETAFITDDLFSDIKANPASNSIPFCRFRFGVRYDSSRKLIPSFSGLYVPLSPV